MTHNMPSDNERDPDVFNSGRVCQELAKRPFDSGPPVRPVLNELGSPWPERMVDVQVGSLEESWGDPLLIKQVWLNLLENARKYTRTSAAAAIEICNGCIMKLVNFERFAEAARNLAYYWYRLNQPSGVVEWEQSSRHPSL